MAIAFAWMARRARAKTRHVFPTPPPERPQFRVTMASGRSLRNIATRFGGGSNALEIIVTDGELWIRIGYPFNILFSGAEYDLCHRIPLDRIHTVKPRGTLLGRGVQIEFPDEAGEEHRIQIEMRRLDRFLETVPPREPPETGSLLRPAVSPDHTLLRPVTSGTADRDPLLRAFSDEE